MHPIGALLAAVLACGGIRLVDGGARCGCLAAASRGLTFAQGVAESRARATVVFRGRVVRADPLPTRAPWEVPMVGSPSGVAHLVVAAVWKGEVGDTAVMRLVNATSCAWWPTAGSEYVVFATRLQDGRLYTQQCAGTVSLGRADSTLMALGPPVRRGID